MSSGQRCSDKLPSEKLRPVGVTSPLHSSNPDRPNITVEVAAFQRLYGSTRKFVLLFRSPAGVVTLTCPEVAPEGTTTEICVAETTV